MQRTSEFPVLNPVVGIAGYAGSGKSALAERICKHFGPTHATILPFAQPVKALARSMGWNGEKDSDGRRLLQLLGTECGRECIDPQIWVRKWQKAATKALRRQHAVVADGLRFANEADAVLELGGLLVKVTRPGCQPRRSWKSLWLRAPRAHASERPLPDSAFHLIFENDGDLAGVDAFAKHVVSILQESCPCS